VNNLQPIFVTHRYVNVELVNIQKYFACKTKPTSEAVMSVHLPMLESLACTFIRLNLFSQKRDICLWLIMKFQLLQNEDYKTVHKDWTNSSKWMLNRGVEFHYCTKIRICSQFSTFWKRKSYGLIIKPARTLITIMYRSVQTTFYFIL
jgi:hypothetical protein